ncbi:MAG: hypothetical protein WBC97_00655 [Gemmatimonadales bacterium]
MRLVARRTLALITMLAGTGAVRAAAQAPTVSISGVGYMQYGYQLKDTANHANAFDVTRAYLNVIGKFSDGISTRITGDVYRAATDNSMLYRLKYAYVTYAPNKTGLSYRFGLTQTPMLDWEEGLYDYRMQGAMPMERGGYITSSDFGLAVDGNWGTDAAVNMQAGIYNGEGYHGATGDQRKDVEARVSMRLMPTDEGGSRGGLRLTGFVQYGTPTGGGQRQRFLGMASYKTKQYLVAAEYASTTDSSTTGPTPSTKGSVLSAYGYLKVPNSKFALLARVDVVDPNTATTTGAGAKQTRLIAGVSYQVSPNLRTMIDLDNNSWAGGSTPVQDLTRSTLYFQTQMTF